MIELAGRVEGAIQVVERQLPKGFTESVWAPISKGTLEQPNSFLSHAKLNPEGGRRANYAEIPVLTTTITRTWIPRS